MFNFLQHCFHDIFFFCCPFSTLILTSNRYSLNVYLDFELTFYIIFAPLMLRSTAKNVTLNHLRLRFYELTVFCPVLRSL